VQLVEIWLSDWARPAHSSRYAANQMNSSASEIHNAIDVRGATAKRISDNEFSLLLAQVRDTFVAPTSGFWWEKFRKPTASIRFEDDACYTRLSSLLPNPDEPCWLLVGVEDAS